jgi:hypothetical protein
LETFGFRGFGRFFDGKWGFGDKLKVIGWIKNP